MEREKYAILLNYIYSGLSRFFIIWLWLKNVLQFSRRHRQPPFIRPRLSFRFVLFSSLSVSHNNEKSYETYQWQYETTTE